MKNKFKLSKKSGKNFCDDLWAKIIKIKFNKQCPICKSMGIEENDVLLNAHHLISRRVFKYRWDTDNGILLCPKHHEFDLYLSAHTAPWGFEEWMKNNRAEQYEKWLENRKNLDSGESSYDYDSIYYKLEKEYKELTGEFHMIKRISMFLLHENESMIKMEHKIHGKKPSELAKEHNVSLAVMSKFLKG